MLLEDALKLLQEADTVFNQTSLGAAPKWALPINVTRHTASLFTTTMFRPIPDGGFGDVFKINLLLCWLCLITSWISIDIQAA